MIKRLIILLRIVILILSLTVLLLTLPIWITLWIIIGTDVIEYIDKILTKLCNFDIEI